jgi:hypothetical protein
MNMPNRVGGLADGREKDRHGADLNRQVFQGIDRASRVDPGRDASAENLARVKAAGDRPWVAGTQDDVSAANSGKHQRREN